MSTLFYYDIATTLTFYLTINLQPLYMVHTEGGGRVSTTNPPRKRSYMFMEAHTCTCFLACIYMRVGWTDHIISLFWGEYRILKGVLAPLCVHIPERGYS